MQEPDALAFFLSNDKLHAGVNGDIGRDALQPFSDVGRLRAFEDQKLQRGWLIERLGFIPVLSTCFLIACINVALIGKPGLSLFLLFAVVFVAGWCITGAQPGVNALSATY